MSIGWYWSCVTLQLALLLPQYSNDQSQTNVLINHLGVRKQQTFIIIRPPLKIFFSTISIQTGGGGGKNKILRPPDWPQLWPPAGQETNFFKGGLTVRYRQVLVMLLM